MAQPNQDSSPLDQRSGDPGGGATAASMAAAQPLLSEVEAAALEFSKKIVSLFFQLKQDSIPTGRIELQSPEKHTDKQYVTSPYSEAPSSLSVLQDAAEDSIPTGRTELQSPDVTSPLSEVEAAAPSPLSEAKDAARDFLKGRKYEYYRPLYHAANGGDWKTAKHFIVRDPSASTARITSESLTTLMVAARARQWKFVQKLLEEVPSKSLAAVDVYGRTALHYTAMGGSVKTAKALIRKNSDLPQIRNKDEECPLIDGFFSSKEMVWYLILVTRDEQPSFPFTGPMSGLLVLCLIKSGYYDILLHLLKRYPKLAFAQNEGRHLLLRLSVQPLDFLSGSNLIFFGKDGYINVVIHVKVSPHFIWMNRKDFLPNSRGFPNALVQPSSILTQVLKWLNTFLWKAFELAPPLKQIREEKMKHVYAVELVNHVCTQLSVSKTLEQTIEFFDSSPHILIEAAERGIVEMISTCLQYFPDLIFIRTNEYTNLLHVAIAIRQPKIFIFFQEMPTILALLNGPRFESETTLHLAAKLAPSFQLWSVSGAVFQMQRELQWFKEVEKISDPVCKAVRNKHGLTPIELFTKEHKELAKEGETWMKDTSDSGMIVTTLIATVVLAAAFTVPGGNNGKGIPNFLHKNSFLIFVVSDALALFSAVTSLFMFLSIRFARYEQKDFLRVLPKRLIIGLGSLFFAIATMMVAFGATLSIVVSERWQWAYIPIILLASIPVTIFAMLQLPLFFQMINSTYGSGILSS